MALFVTGVGLLIHLYSIGYMRGDPKFSKFFLYMNLFLLSMLVLILGNNMPRTFLGQRRRRLLLLPDLLLAHTQSAATAGKKAFITNRIGDWLHARHVPDLRVRGVVELGRAQRHRAELSSATVSAVALLLFVGAIGKSAQLPLYIWLPDAMEGPTPVSALIRGDDGHRWRVCAARINPVLSAATETSTVIAIVGLATAFIAATIAVAQNDIKRVLAYSTISQLGYMFLAVGCGATWRPCSTW